jgi:hypothetical protein
MDRYDFTRLDTSLYVVVESRKIVPALWGATEPKKYTNRQKWVQPLDMVDKSINPLRTHFKPVFSSLGSPDRPSHPGVRPHPTSSAGTLPNHSMTCHCPCTWADGLSSGSRRQWASEHLASRPSSMCSPRCHRWGSQPVALCQTFAPSFSWLHERYSQ